MNSKLLLVFFFSVITFLNANSFSTIHANFSSPKSTSASQHFKGSEFSVDAFLNLTPTQFEKMTGKKLSFKDVVKLKAAQKLLKKEMNKGGDQIPKGLYIVLAIFGWTFIAMGIMDDWSGNNWWMNLILTMLCWLPGFIHALVKMKEYYK